MEKSQNSIMYTVDKVKVPKMAENHHIIVKDAKDITCDDLDKCKNSLGLLFFDCHNYEIQMSVFDLLKKHNMITNSTLLALHDTGFVNYYEYRHGRPCGPVLINNNYRIRKRALNAKIKKRSIFMEERKMVNKFMDIGYSCINYFPNKSSVFTEIYNLAFRPGLSICQMKKELDVTER